MNTLYFLTILCVYPLCYFRTKIFQHHYILFWLSLITSTVLSIVYPLLKKGISGNIQKYILYRRKTVICYVITHLTNFP